MNNDLSKLQSQDPYRLAQLLILCFQTQKENLLCQGIDKSEVCLYLSLLFGMYNRQNRMS